MEKEFLDLGIQPLANGFLDKKQFKNEKFYNLKAQFNTETHLVTIVDTPKKEDLFNNNYPYVSSSSTPMIAHFKDIAETIIGDLKDGKILEIGSNDGIFIKNFPKDKAFCIEPCSNFSDITNNLGYKTYNKFWNMETSNEIKQNHGLFDVIFSANCMCHISNIQEAFNSISNLLTNDGRFIFEDPSLAQVILNGSYDQFYDEHPNIFSILSLRKLLYNSNLTIEEVVNTPIHGGSNLIIVRKQIGFKHDSISIRSVQRNIWLEKDILGLDKEDTYHLFAQKIHKSKIDLIELLEYYRLKGKNIVSYGATSKSTTIFNYCGINQDLICQIVDTTPSKIGKYSPGMHIPIYDRNTVTISNIDVFFLGAWNFSKEIIAKESNFKGKCITHIPLVREI